MGTLATLKCAYSEIMSHAPTWMNLDDIELGEMSQAQRDKYYVIPFMRHLEWSHSRRKGVQLWLPGPKGWGEKRAVV